MNGSSLIVQEVPRVRCILQTKQAPSLQQRRRQDAHPFFIPHFCGPYHVSPKGDRMMRNICFIPSWLLLAPLFMITTGCASIKSIPSDITLRDALLQVKDGIELLQEKQKNSKPAGLLISEVQVSFNITANAKDSTKIGLDLAPGGMIPKGNFESTSEVGLARSNQISFKFQNLFLANKDTLVGLSVTPITTTSEKTTTKGKDSESTTEKTPQVMQPITLEQLFLLLNDKIILKSQ